LKLPEFLPNLNVLDLPQIEGQELLQPLDLPFPFPVSYGVLFGLLHEVSLLLGKRGDGFFVCGDYAVKVSNIGIEGARRACVVCEA
jgi:hypothetical protein